MQLSCPTCASSIRVDDAYAGTRVNCPGCGQSVTAVEAGGAAEADFVEPMEERDPIAPAAPQAGTAEPTKTCPMCGGTIKAVARKCRFCGEYLTDVPGDQGRGTFGVWRDGNKLVMSKEAQLPYVCVKSNQPASGWLKRKLYWHHPAYYLALLAGLLVFVVIALIVRKTANIQVALSDKWFRRRRWAIAGGWLGVIVGFGLLVTGIANSAPGNSAVFLIPVGLLMFLIAAVAGAMNASIVRPSRITNTHVWLKGVHPEFLATLPAWPGEG